MNVPKCGQPLAQPRTDHLGYHGSFLSSINFNFNFRVRDLRLAISPIWSSASSSRYTTLRHHYQESNEPSAHASTMADEGIDRKEDERMVFETSSEVEVAPTFENMNLKDSLLRGIYAYGYERPSAVQARAIVQICKGRDTIAQAQSGTGKTATFSISLLQVLDTNVRETQGKARLHIIHSVVFN